MKDLYDAKKTLKEKGWSYRSASPYLNVTATHLCLVLTGGVSPSGCSPPSRLCPTHQPSTDPNIMPTTIEQPKPTTSELDARARQQHLAAARLRVAKAYNMLNTALTTDLLDEFGSDQFAALVKLEVLVQRLRSRV